MSFEWAAIETAPKDGTPVLVARYMGEPWGWVRGWAHWEDVQGISGWISRGFFDVPGNLGLGAPTHWMPIPPPPVTYRGLNVSENQIDLVPALVMREESHTLAEITAALGGDVKVEVTQ